MQNTLVDPALAPPRVKAQSNRWIQLLAGLVCMMAISSPQYVWTLLTRPLAAKLGVALPELQITFSLLIILQTFFSPFQGKLIDRFGLPPQTVKTLIDSHRLRLLAKPLGVQKLDASEVAIQVHFVKNPPIDPMKIIQLLQTKRNYKLAGQDKLRVEAGIDDVALRVVRVKELLKELSA